MEGDEDEGDEDGGYEDDGDEDGGYEDLTLALF
jgi:hypothetical protein